MRDQPSEKALQEMMPPGWEGGEGNWSHLYAQFVACADTFPSLSPAVTKAMAFDALAAFRLFGRALDERDQKIARVVDAFNPAGGEVDMPAELGGEDLFDALEALSGD